MCCESFPLVTLGAFGLGSTWAAIPPSLGDYCLSREHMIAVGILGTLYLGLDVASYIPVARQVGGIIRIAITIIAGPVILPRCVGDYVSSARTMLIGQLAKGIFETFVPLPSALYDKCIRNLYFAGFVTLEYAATWLNAIRLWIIVINDNGTD